MTHTLRFERRLAQPPEKVRDPTWAAQTETGWQRCLDELTRVLSQSA